MCDMPITPLPPDPVEPETIDVTLFTVENGRFFLSLNFSYPEKVNGPVTRFDVRVTVDPLLPDENPEESQLVIQRQFEVSLQ